MSSAKNFGAVGDGKADDTAALEHAVEQGDGIMDLPKGSYRITRTIQLDLTRHGYLGVRGRQGTARLIMDGAGPALRVIGNHQGTAQPESVRPLTWSGERMPMISGLEILGRHELADGIQLVRTMQATVTGVLLRQCRYGIHLTERNRNFILSAAHIYDCRDTGVFFDNCNLHQVIITGNHISYAKRAGIRQLNGDVHNVQITGNDIEYNSGATGTSGEIVLEAPEGVISEYTISANTLQATSEAAGANLTILGQPEDPPASVRLVNITGNVLGSREQNIVVQHGSQTSITGNTIYGGATRNVTLTACRNVVLGSNTIGTRPAGYRSETVDGVLLDRCVACSLVGNVISDSRHGEQEKGGAVTIRACRHVGVSACQILDPHVRGIDILDSTDCRISDNSVAEMRDAKSMTCAIRVSGRSRQNVVQNCMVSKGKTDAIQCLPEAGTLQGNTILRTSNE